MDKLHDQIERLLDEHEADASDAAIRARLKASVSEALDRVGGAGLDDPAHSEDPTRDLAKVAAFLDGGLEPADRDALLAELAQDPVRRADLDSAAAMLEDLDSTVQVPPALAAWAAQQLRANLVANATPPREAMGWWGRLRTASSGALTRRRPVWASAAAFAFIAVVGTGVLLQDRATQSPPAGRDLVRVEHSEGPLLSKEAAVRERPREASTSPAGSAADRIAPTAAAPPSASAGPCADVWSHLARVQLFGTLEDLEGFSARFPNCGVDQAVRIAIERRKRKDTLVAGPVDAPVLSDPRGAFDTVRAFYAALGTGDGRGASELVVPEKRATGPLSAEELRRSQSVLSEPLRLVDIRPIGQSKFEVTYNYSHDRRSLTRSLTYSDRSNRAGSCRATAIVTVVERDGRSYIDDIATTGSC